VLPPPLNSLFGSAGGGVPGSGNYNHGVSDNASVDGLSAVFEPSHNRQSSNASVSASVASAGGAGGGAATHATAGGSQSNSNLPLHMRVGMAPCDPLLVFDGKYAVVATCDGRLVIYTIFDFERRGSIILGGKKINDDHGTEATNKILITRHISEDIEASERRRRAEWEEEDLMEEEFWDEDEKKFKLIGNPLKSRTSSTDSMETSDSEIEEEEENESDMRERMSRRERAKETVEPILIVNVPIDTQSSCRVKKGKRTSRRENSRSDTSEEVDTLFGAAFFDPPTIVSMCATPGRGMSLVEKRDVIKSSRVAKIDKIENDSDFSVDESGPLVPNIDDDSLLGHLSVLTDDGCVHILEFINCQPASRSEEKSLQQQALDKSESGVKSGFDKVQENNGVVLVVNIILSFRTGILGATCLCMRPIPSLLSDPEHSNLHDLPERRSNDAANIEDDKNLFHRNSIQSQKIRLCIGHGSGIVVEYQIFSECIYPAVRKCRSSPKRAEKVLATIGSPPLFNVKDSIKNDIDSSQKIQTTTPSDTPTSLSKNTPRRSIHEKQSSSSNVALKLFSRSRSNEYNASVMSLGDEGSVPSSPEQPVSRTLFDYGSNTTPTLRRTISEPMTPDALSLDESAKTPNPIIRPAEVELKWRGNMGIPISSLSCPGWDLAREGEKAGGCFDEKSQNRRGKSSSLLVVGLAQRQSLHGIETLAKASPDFAMPNQQLSPSISIDVINTTLAEVLWSQIPKNAEKTLEEDIVGCVPLNNCSVWPAAGKEVKDGWLRTSGRTRTRKDEMLRKLGLQKTAVAEKACCFQDSSQGLCFAFAVSDGTVAISYCDGESWGIYNGGNQIMLCQKSIGLGTVTTCKDDEASHSRYITCCLRGGTIYLVPVVEPSYQSTMTKNQNISMFTVPCDPSGEDDAVGRYVQAFSAGMAQVTPWQEAHDPVASSTDNNNLDDVQGVRKPIAMVCWPGNIDVYEIKPVQ